MKEVHTFKPHDAMHREFGEALRHAAACGVKMLAMDCLVTPNSIKIDTPIKISLQ